MIPRRITIVLMPLVAAAAWQCSAHTSRIPPATGASAYWNAVCDTQAHICRTGMLKTGEQPQDGYELGHCDVKAGRCIIAKSPSGDAQSLRLSADSTASSGAPHP
jgi:hypothetical protein